MLQAGSGWQGRQQWEDQKAQDVPSTCLHPMPSQAQQTQGVGQVPPGKTGQWETRNQAVGQRDLRQSSLKQGRRLGAHGCPAASFLSPWMLHFLTEIHPSLSLPLYLAVVRVGIRKILSVLESGLTSVGAGSHGKWPFRGSVCFLAPVITLVLFDEHGCSPETGRL